MHAANHQPVRAGAYCSTYLSIDGVNKCESTASSTHAPVGHETAGGAFSNVVGRGKMAAVGNGHCCVLLVPRMLSALASRVLQR